LEINGAVVKISRQKCHIWNLWFKFA